MVDDNSEMAHRPFFSDSRDLMVIADAEGLITEVNPAWSDVLGWSSEQVLARPFIDFVHPDDVGATLMEFETIRAGLPTVAFENRFQCRDGSYVRFEWSATPVGAVVYGIGRDVTHRDFSNAALRESEARSRSVLETVMSGIVMIDGSGVIEGFNRAAERIFGYQAAEVMGLNVKMLMPQPYQDEHDGYLERYLETGERRIIGLGREVQGLRKDGSVFPLNLAVTEVEIDHRRLFTGVVEDATERNAAIEAVRQARADAEAASRAKNDFLSRMSHELRTPLNAIMGFAQLLELDATSIEQQEASATIVSAGRHLLGLINEVLDISLIEAGQLQLSPEAVSVAEVMHDCLAFITQQAGQRHIELVNRNGHGLFVRADRQRLRQVVLNLLSNAVKYGYEGGQIAVEVSTTSDGRIRIAVADTGPGIHPDAVERIFNAFERLGAADTDIEGTGLGLALAAHLVDAMGGTIGVQSKLGEGSTFWLEMIATDEPAAQTVLIDAGIGPDRADGSVGTLLYIEDNLSNVRLIERILARRSQIVLLTATRGQTGLEIAESHQPDLIFLDLNLPDLPGRQVLAHLLSNPATKHIPVVVLSADASRGQIRRLVESGAREFMTKPIDVQKVLRVLDKFIVDPPD